MKQKISGPYTWAHLMRDMEKHQAEWDAIVYGTLYPNLTLGREAKGENSIPPLPDVHESGD